MEDVFDGFAIFISVVPMELVGPRLRPGASRLWSHIWQNKSRYSLWLTKSDDDYPAEAASEPDTGAGDAGSGTVMLLRAYQSLYEAK